MARDADQMRNEASEIFHAGLEAVRADRAVKRHLGLDGDRLVADGRIFELPDYRNVYVIGAGKASASMAKVVEELLGERISGGLVSVKYGHGTALNRVKLVEAGHPVPDAAGQRAARDIMGWAARAQEKDLVICVLSGGGSALMPLPATRVTLEDKQETTKLLLACGATIHEINTVRKHISRIKGGGLARQAHPATLLCLILSDVVGDDLQVVASGPTVPDSSRFQDCMSIFEKYGIKAKLPRGVLRHIQEGLAGLRQETPKEGAPVFARTFNVIVGSNMECVLSAEKTARRLGYRTLILSSMIEGEARHVAQVHTAIAKEVLKSGHPLPAPACILSGGETTVTVKGTGLGGRNQEFVLAAALGLRGADAVVVLSGGTDGTDGPTDAAGALADGRTIQKAEAVGLDAPSFLADNNAYRFFEAVGGLIKTGPTGTNVMDLQIILVG